jgi:hypothetical protein
MGRPPLVVGEMSMDMADLIGLHLLGEINGFGKDAQRTEEEVWTTPVPSHQSEQGLEVSSRSMAQEMHLGAENIPGEERGIMGAVDKFFGLWMHNQLTLRLTEGWTNFFQIECASMYLYMYIAMDKLIPTSFCSTATIS